MRGKGKRALWSPLSHFWDPGWENACHTGVVWECCVPILYTTVTPLCSPHSPPHPGTAELPPHTTASPANTTSPTPGDSGQFLGVLTLFIRRVLSPRSEPPTQPSSQHWLDFQMMETLPHQLLNLSETAGQIGRAHV